MQAHYEYSCQSVLAMSHLRRVHSIPRAPICIADRAITKQRASVHSRSRRHC